MATREDFDRFLSRLQAARPPRPAAPVVRPSTDAARIALLKVALDQFLLQPGPRAAVAPDVWEFAQHVRDLC